MSPYFVSLPTDFPLQSQMSRRMRMFRYVLKFELQKHGAGKIRGLYLGSLVDGSIDPIAFDSSREEVELVSYTGFTGPLGKITSLRLTFEFDKKYLI